MPGETLKAKKLRAAAIIDRLEEEMPEAQLALHCRTPLELLVSVILSAQCTDERVNQVTPRLFVRYPDARAYAQARPTDIEEIIKSCGLYRSKAKSLIAACRSLIELHGGAVPHRRSELTALPGVGRKTAGVVCIHLGGEAAFPVDTHVGRLARRLGLSAESNPDKVERDLSRLLPERRWARAHQLLVWHGRRTCRARRPGCGACAVGALCPKTGVSPPLV